MEESEYRLETRFGAEGLRLLPEIRKIQDVDLRKAVYTALKHADNLEEVRRLYTSSS